MATGILARNTTYYTGALVLQKILSFVYFWFISNALIPGQLGQYVFALSFTTLFSILVDLGLSPVLTREASKDKDQGNTYLQNVLGIKIPLAILTLVAAWLVITVTSKPDEVKLLIYLASFIMVLDSFSLSFWVIFRSRHTLVFESIATIIVQIIIFSLGLFALQTTGQVRHLIMALLTASVFNFCVAALLLKTKLKFRLKPRWNNQVVIHLLKIIPAFALAGVFVKIYNAADSVLLSFLAGDVAVGFFAVPAKVIFAFQQIIPNAFAAVIFPAFSFYFANSLVKLTETFHKAIRYLVILSFPLTAGLVVLANDVVTTLWPSYVAVIPTFIIMALAIPFIFLAFPTGYLLNACDQQRKNTLNRGIITTLAVVLNLILIPQFTYFGAGITFLITNVLLLLLDTAWIGRVIKLQPRLLLSMLGKSLVATGLMIVVLVSLKASVHFLLLIPAGVMVYFATLYLIKGFVLDELKLLKRSS